MLKNISEHITRTLTQANHHFATMLAWFKKPNNTFATEKTKAKSTTNLNFSYDFTNKNTEQLSYQKFAYLPTYAQLISEFMGNYGGCYWHRSYGYPKKSNNAQRPVFIHKYLDYHIPYYAGKYSQYNPYQTIQPQLALVVYEDIDTINLKLQIQSLENEIGTYDSQRAELEKLLADFNHRHMLELGDIISEILALKKQLAKQNEDDIAFEETQNFEREYREQLHEEKQKIRHTLNVSEEKLLKKLYRKASSLCHPDRVRDDQKSFAEEIFHELRQAYEENDLAKVRTLLSQLEQGIFVPQSKTISQKDKLKTLKQQMQGKLERIIHAINDIKKSPSYQEIMEIDNWDNYFAEQKSLLIQEKERLQERLCVTSEPSTY